MLMHLPDVLLVQEVATRADEIVLNVLLVSCYIRAADELFYTCCW
jgi:hypothetical protein